MKTPLLGSSGVLARQQGIITVSLAITIAAARSSPSLLNRHNVGSSHWALLFVNTSGLTII
ncbi:hypothetical protein AKJ16_DCAP05151 [Drosera capensis]